MAKLIKRLVAGLVAITLGVLVGGSIRLYLNDQAAAPLAGITPVQALPVVVIPSSPTSLIPSPLPSPTPLPSRVLLQVPFTTQAPLGNWALHQESCEAANLTMLVLYWQKDSEVVINPHTADGMINQIDSWKSRPDLTNTMLGQLSQAHYGYAYKLVPNTQTEIAQELSAGRPLLAEVRTHGLGNSNYPGYRTHYEQTGWSVPHFVLIEGYDESGVWLNDAGISKGRGYHISYAQLSHAIDDLDVHHPSLNEGQVLLEMGPPPPALPEKIHLGSLNS